MEPLSPSAQTVLDFLTLLQREKNQENSDIFDAATWQELTQLSATLDTLSESIAIAEAILDWCEKHPKIEQVFNQTDWSKVRSDMDDETNGPIPPPNPKNEGDVVENKYQIQRIIKSTDYSGGQTQNTQNNPNS
jgi:hypothetical protein